MSVYLYDPKNAPIMIEQIAIPDDITLKQYSQFSIVFLIRKWEKELLLSL